MVCETDYDWRVFDKFGFTSKSKVIKMKFHFEDEVLEKPEQNVISSGIIDNMEFIKKNE